MNKKIRQAARRLGAVIAVMTLLIAPVIMTGCSSSVEDEIQGIWRWNNSGTEGYGLTFGPNDSGTTFKFEPDGKGSFSDIVNGTPVIIKNINYTIEDNRVEYKILGTEIVGELFYKDGDLYLPNGDKLHKVK